MQEKQIASTPREKINPFAYQNTFVYECYVQIRSILSNRLSEKHANIFAEPIFDNLNNCIDWYSTLQGEAKLLSECDISQQNEIRKYLANLAQEITECAHSLKESNNNTYIVAGNIIDLAMQYPDENSCIYIIDEQPVIICWGFEPVSAGVKAQDLRRLSALPILEQKAEEPEPIQKVIPSQNDEPVEKKPFRFSWYWLIIPLILLLLFLILSGRIPIPGLSLPNFSASNFSLPKFSLPDFSSTKPDIKIPKNNLYNLQLEPLYLELEKNRALCLSNKEKAIPTINVPQNVKSLQGSWICATDIVTSKNIPVIMKFRFDGKGIGQVSINSDGDICTAPTKGVFTDESSFTITTDTEIACQSGSAFAKQRITCVNTQKGTMCIGRNLNEASHWNATFQKDE